MQVIRLDPKTGNKDSQSKIIKQTYGLMNGHSVALNKAPESKTTYLSEGIETGLSILEANPNFKVNALLSKSNFLNVDLSKLTEHVVFCVDNDGKKTFEDLVIAKSALRIIESGRAVSIAIPEKDGDDFNDVIKTKGIAEVNRQLASMADAKSLLKAEIKAIKSANNVRNTNLNELNHLQKINGKITKIAAHDKKQMTQFKTMDLNNRQLTNRLTDLHRSTISEYKKPPIQPIKTNIQKELER